MTLLEHTPQEYRYAPEIQVIEAALDNQLQELWAVRDDLLAQLVPTTATWGLELWEQAYGLDSELSVSIERRRERVAAKMRGRGTTTAALIRNVAESFSGLVVEVVEQPHIYQFKIKFLGYIGLPPNIAALSEAIEEIKPAHLAFHYEVSYRTWRKVSAMSWGQTGVHSWEEIYGGDF